MKLHLALHLRLRILRLCEYLVEIELVWTGAGLRAG